MTNSHPFFEKISGNLIPGSWYKIFKSCGKPDLIAITVLGEVLFRYRTGEVLKGKWKVSYAYFENKFEFSKNQIRAALARLESFKVLSREIQTEVCNSRKYAGVMYLVFNHEQLETLQKNFSPHEKKLTPPYEKSESNERSNEIILTNKDLEKIAKDTNRSIDFCNSFLSDIKKRYPNLIFTSKQSLANYLQKSLRSKQSLNESSYCDLSEEKESIFEVGSKVYKYDAKAACEFCDKINTELSKAIDIPFALKNSFLLLKDSRLLALCDKKLVQDNLDLIIKCAKKILDLKDITLEFLPDYRLLEKEMFALLKLRLYFMHGHKMFSSWFAKMNFGFIKGHKLVLFVATDFIKNWINEYYSDTILSCVRSIDSSIFELEICV